MKLYIGFLLALFSIGCFAQEKPSVQINWNELNNNFPIHNIDYYTIQLKQIIPSLSFFREKTTSINNHSLPEINLAIDIRKQGLRDESPIMLQLPKNQFIQPDYVLSIPEAPKGNFTISGRRYTNDSNSSSTGSNRGVKNIAYKDASLYTRLHYPITGLPLN